MLPANTKGAYIFFDPPHAHHATALLYRHLHHKYLVVEFTNGRGVTRVTSFASVLDRVPVDAHSLEPMVLPLGWNMEQTQRLWLDELYHRITTQPGEKIPHGVRPD